MIIKEITAILLKMNFGNLLTVLHLEIFLTKKFFIELKKLCNFLLMKLLVL